MNFNNFIYANPIDSTIEAISPSAQRILVAGKPPANVAEARKTGEAVAMTQEQVEQMVKTVWKLAKEKIDAGKKGVCTGEGFYKYTK